MPSNPKHERSEQQALPTVYHTNKLLSSSKKSRGWHQTTFKFTFAISVKQDRFREDETAVRLGKKNRVTSSSSKRTVYQDSYYFHIEYLSEPSQTFSTDVVFFTSLLAKVYPYGKSSHIVKPVEYQGKLWVVWTEHIPVECTDTLIQEYAKLSRTTGLPIKCWNARDKCSISARFDKPRSVFLEQDANELVRQGVSPIEATITRLCTKTSEHCHEECIEMSDDQTTDSEMYGLSRRFDKPDSKHAKAVRQPSSRSGTVSRATNVVDNKQGITPRSFITIRSRGNNVEPSPQTLAVEAHGSFCVVLNPGFHFLHQPPEEIVAHKPSCLAELVMQPLTCSTWLQQDTVCEDFLVAWETSQPLLSTEQRQKFRPLVIRAKYLNNLPKGRYSDYDKMQNDCYPLHFTWKFSDQETYVSRKYKQQKIIHFTDMQVLLTGYFSTTRLKEILLSEPLVINVFDRIPRKRTTVESATTKKAMGIFGSLDNDCNIGRVQASMPTVPSKLSPAVADHQFTVEKVPSAQILVHLDNFITMKEKRSKIHNPVLPINETDIDFSIVLRSTSENPRRSNRKYIGYLDSGCELRLTVELGAELNDEMVVDGRENTEILYERLVAVVNKTANASLPRRPYITEIEECLFKTGTSTPKHSTKYGDLAEDTKVKLPCRSPSNKRSRSCELNDELTGVHISDSQGHVLIIEWCVNDYGEALKKRLLQLVDRVSLLEGNSEQIRFLYNSAVKFTARLYPEPLKPCSEECLTKSLDELSQQPMLYVRDSIPRLAYCAINRLRYIRKYCHSVTDILHAGQFPTAEMIQALTKLYTVPRILSSSLSLLKNSNNQRQSVELADNTATTFSGEKIPTSDIVLTGSDENQRNKTRAKGFQHYQITPSCEEKVFNYSSQAQNTTLATKHELWSNVLDHRERYTYSQNYLHSGSFEPHVSDIQWQSTLRAFTQRSKSLDKKKGIRGQTWDNFSFQKGHEIKGVP